MSITSANTRREALRYAMRPKGLRRTWPEHKHTPGAWCLRCGFVAVEVREWTKVARKGLEGLG